MSRSTLGDGSAAHAAGIRFVHQDLGLVGTLNAIDNLAITAGYQTGRGGRIRWRGRPAARAKRSAASGSPISTSRRRCTSLHPSQRTAIAIARALVGWEDGASLLILDEPTATLPGAEVRRLFDVIHRLASAASRSSTSRTTSTRCSSSPIGSPSCATGTQGDASRRATSTTVARRVDGRPPRSTPSVDDEATIGTPRAHGARPAWRAPSKGIDIDVMPGEIVGLAGITGSGREHVLGLIAGQTRVTTATSRSTASRSPTTGRARRSRRCGVRSRRARLPRHDRPDEGRAKTSRSPTSDASSKRCA